VPQVHTISGVKTQSASIDDLAEAVRKIWGQRDTVRPPLVQWLGVVAHTSRLVEFVRRTHWDKVVIEIGEIFVWWLSFLNRLAQEPVANNALALTNAVLYVPGKVSDIIWAKYPGVCPVCFGLAVARQEGIVPTEKRAVPPPLPPTVGLVEMYKDVWKARACRCLSNKETIENRQDWFKTYTKQAIAAVSSHTKTHKPRTLNGMENMFRALYSSNYDVMSTVEVALHLQEEVGEIAEAMQKLYNQPHRCANGRQFGLDTYRVQRAIRVRALGEELADVFSWLVAMRESTQRIMQTAPRFSSELAKRSVERKQVEGEAVSPKEVARVVRRAISPSRSLLELTLHIFNYNGELSCDVCKRPTCSSADPLHGDSNGMLFGDEVRRFFDVIAETEPIA
jgi:NTP pyrophosphatase (non-canonical NTP hydrolase)